MIEMSLIRDRGECLCLALGVTSQRCCDKLYFGNLPTSGRVGILFV